MNLQRATVIYAKEMKDLLRDKRTVYSMILIPILLMPLLYLGIGAFMAKRISSLQAERSTVAWISSGSAIDLQRQIESADIVELIHGLTDTLAVIELIRENNLDAAVYIPAGFEADMERGFSDSTVYPEITVFMNKTRQSSEFAQNKVIHQIQNYRDGIVNGSLKERGISPRIIKPFKINPANIATQKEMGGHIMGVILPYMVILMVLTGATYPAVDLTAGEKERGTLETLLVAGVSRFDIAIGKFLAVLSVSIVTAVLSISSMAGTGLIALKMAPQVGKAVSISVDPSMIAVLAIAIIPLAVLFSSLLMTLSLFARSYKEAQSYISPLMILVIVPAMASMVPDIELTLGLALVPVLNVSLLMKQGFVGQIEPVALAVTMGANVLYAAIGLLLVVRMFRKESVLFKM